jgi:hypothetical protein
MRGTARERMRTYAFSYAPPALSDAFLRGLDDLL